jgi:hypothetical protein
MSAATVSTVGRAAMLERFQVSLADVNERTGAELVAPGVELR